MFFTFLTKFFKKHHLSLIKSVLVFIFFVTILQSVLWVGHFIVYQTITTFFPLENPFIFNLFTSLFFWLSMSFVFFSIIGSYTYHPIIRFFYTLSAWWIGTMYWLVLGSVCLSLLFLVTASLGFFPAFDALLVIMVLLAFGISMYGTLHSRHIRENHIRLAIKNLPPYWQGKKMVLLADTHFGHVWTTKRASAIAEMVKKHTPEAVLIPGDFYDGPPAPYQALAKPFGAIPAPSGVYFCAGNHEQFREITPYTEGLKDASIRVLTNEAHEVHGINIIGLTYLDSQTSETTSNLLSSLTRNDIPNILLKHVPKHPEATAKNNIDLQVSGHTHKGQVWPFHLLTRATFKGYDAGLKYYENSAILTTTGVGTWGPMQRVGTDAEIVIITLEKK